MSKKMRARWWVVDGAVVERREAWDALSIFIRLLIRCREIQGETYSSCSSSSTSDSESVFGAGLARGFGGGRCRTPLAVDAMRERIRQNSELYAYSRSVVKIIKR